MEDNSSKGTPIPIPIIVALIALFGALTPFVYSQVKNLTNEPVITVHNKLVLPVLVKVNGSQGYTKRIEANSSYTFELLSDNDFPAQVSWALIRNRNGDYFIGEDLNGLFPPADKGKEVTITNVLGENTYFYPKIYNNTGQTCLIILNDGLKINEKLGYTNNGSVIGITGYFKFAKNSNVTLRCNNGVDIWRGERNNKNSGKLKLTSQCGLTIVNFP